jgi:hypothetical protein
MGSIRTRMNCICVGLVSLWTWSKLLLQLLSTPQASVFLLENHTWKVKKCLDQLNTKQTFHLGQKQIHTDIIG